MSTFARGLSQADLENFYSGANDHPFYNLGDMVDVHKTAGAVDSSVTGVQNTVYGALVWAQLNNEANMFGIFPKTTWARSGWRVKKQFAETTSTNLSLAETASLPSAKRPDIVTLKATPKLSAQTFEVTDVVEALAEISQDDMWGSVAQMRVEIGNEFVKHINKLVSRRVVGVAATGSETTGPGNSLISIDGIVGNKAETDAASAAAAQDIYGIDRSDSAYAYADSVVKYDVTNGVTLSDTVLREQLASARKNGGNTNVFVTGYDTYAKVLGMYTNFMRYMPISDTKVSFGINGVQSANGLDVGFNVSALFGIPLVTAVDVPGEVDSSGNAVTTRINRIYGLDLTDTEGYGLPRIAMTLLRPVEYFETRDYALLNKFAVKGVYRMVGELVARNYVGQFKIRDIIA